MTRFIQLGNGFAFDGDVNDLIGKYIIRSNEIFSIFLLENVWEITDYYYDDQTDISYLRFLAKNIATDEEKEVLFYNYRVLDFTERRKIFNHKVKDWTGIDNLTWVTVETQDWQYMDKN